MSMEGNVESLDNVHKEKYIHSAVVPNTMIRHSSGEGESILPHRLALKGVRTGTQAGT